MRLRTVKRRRKEHRTDYKARRILLESKMPRIVLRRTNKYYILQLVESDSAQDRVLFTITSKELLKNGWDTEASGSLKSIPAGYLTGLLMAKKLKKGKYIMDVGMARTFKGGRVFSVVKGLIDGGLDIPANEKVFPIKDRLNGEHLEDNIKDMISRVKGGLN